MRNAILCLAALLVSAGGALAVTNSGDGVYEAVAWRLSAGDLGGSSGSTPGSLHLADFDRDGVLDLALQCGLDVQVWLGDAEGSMVRAVRLADMRLNGVVDVDQDGDPDLCLSSGGTFLLTLLNDGQGDLAQEVRFDAPASVDGSWSLLQVAAPGATGQPVALWYLPQGRPQEDPSALLLTDVSLAEGLTRERRLDIGVPLSDLRRVLDVDADGHEDAVVNEARVIEDTGSLFEPVILHNLGDGAVAAGTPFPDRTYLDGRLWGNPVPIQPAWDLDADGMADLALLDQNYRRGRSVLVMHGTQGQPPVVEGQYALPNRAFGLQAGDVDGDGDLDLVSGTVQENGGLFVLRSRIVPASTAVEEEASRATPTGFGLLPAYPNPFNPATILLLQLPRAGHVDVALYNAAGQRVRTLADRTLPAGRHELSWDGRDGDGRRVAAGLYVCRAAFGGQVMTRKVVRVE